MELNIKENPSASLNYILFLRRDKLSTRANAFKTTIKLTELKLSLTNKLISLNKPQIQYMGFQELRALSRQQIFSKKLETAIGQLYSRKKARPDEKKHTLETQCSERLAKQQAKSDEHRKMGEGNESAKVCTARTNIVERMYEWRKLSPEERRRMLAKQRHERLAKQLFL
ncbi:unnamed protein product [Ceratitis capitata]|uniref:(Mediterranean fruit fly) hypothetical protein n=1 Tax=Ceratitis capitata TaxID=7213 RepID=A0A811UJM0_CERCA|nr:unnamed protein product [Ceratitis capitata]